jgi:hypothetical protein
MKSGEKKKKLAFKKITIAHLDRENIFEINDTLQQIKGGNPETITITEFGSSCFCITI